jgi:hypothetical protein
LHQQNFWCSNWWYIVYSSQTVCVDVLAALIFYKPSGATGTGTASSNAVDSVNGVGVVVLDKVDN